MDSLTIQALHDQMQATYDRIQSSFRPKNYLPEIAAFAQHVFENPFFKDTLQEAIRCLQTDLTPILKLKDPSTQELKATRSIIVNYETFIPVLSHYLEEYDAIGSHCPPASWEATFEREKVIKRICLFLRLASREKDFDAPERMLLRQLVTVDQKNNITGFIFAPSLELFRDEMLLLERPKKTKLWYCFHMLHHLLSIYDLKKSSGQYSFFIENNQHVAALFFQNDFIRLDNALTEFHKDNDFDAEEYKIYVSHIWSLIKPKLLSYEELTYSYRDTNGLIKGIMKKGQKTKELTANSAQILYLALKKKNLSKDEAGEKLPDGDTSKRDQVNNAIGVIRDNAQKVFGLEDYISSQKTIISVNHPTRLIKE
jgi:hypothetical protein